MGRSRLLSWSFLALGLALGSCTHDSTAPPPPPQTRLGPATGHWIADGPDFISTLDLADTVVLATGRGTVRGSGTFTGPGIVGGGVAFAAVGTDSSGAIRLSLTATGHAPAYFTGQMAADTGINGNLDSSGFSHVALKFRRYPVVDSIAVTPRSDSALPG